MPFKSPLPSNWDLPEEIRGRFGERAGKQRAMFAEGHLVLILHAAPKADENERTARLFWRKPEGTWSGHDPAGGVTTVARHLEEYRARLDAVDKALDAATLSTEYFAVLSQLAPLQRSARNLHKALQEARDSIDGDPELITFRDRAYDLERMADLLYEDAKNGLDFAVARRSEEQAFASHRMEVSAHRLNLLAAFFFPLATLSAIFGVNGVDLMRGLENAPGTWTFFGFIGVGIFLGMVLAMFVSSSLPSREGKGKRTPYDKRV